MSARATAVDMWDATLKNWQPGRAHVPEPLRPWSDSYSGKGDGTVVYDAFPEPYIGPLAGTGTPALVMLGLNPGRAHLDLQGPGGVFTSQVAEQGYSAWAASSPYTSPAWESKHGPNKYMRARRNFARRLKADEQIEAKDMLTVELYPWHSTAVKGAMHPPSGALQEWVWEPLAEISVSHVFAFGAAWRKVAARLNFTPLGELDADWEAKTRRCGLFELPSKQTLVVLHHSGSAGPPSAPETERLRQALRL